MFTASPHGPGWTRSLSRERLPRLWRGLPFSAAQNPASVSHGRCWTSRQPPQSLEPGHGSRPAEEAAEKWPDQPIAEYATLYKLQSLTHPYSKVKSIEEAADTIISALKDSEDVFVRQTVLSQLANIATKVKLGPVGDLDLLLKIYDSPDENVSYRHAITVAAMESALFAGDDARAVAWMGRHHEATDGECSPEVLAWRGDMGDWCVKTNQARDNRSSYLAAKGLLAPTTWQAAVGAMVRRCDMEGHALGADLVTASGTWSNGWTWKDWSVPSELAACLELTPHEGPTPPEDTRVALSIYAPKQPAASP